MERSGRPGARSTALACSALRRRTPSRSAPIFPASATRRIRRASTARAKALRAVNALAPGQTLARADYGPLPVHEGALAVAPPLDLRRWLLLAAFIGLLVDALGRCGSGGAPLRRRGAVAALAVAAALGLACSPSRDQRAPPKPRRSRIATGRGPVDPSRLCRDRRRRGRRNVRLGLTTLTQVLATRTSAELAEPVALDPARDELAFYPLIYWPIVAGRPQPKPAGADAHRRLHEERRHDHFRHARRADRAAGRPGDAGGAVAAQDAGRRRRARARAGAARPCRDQELLSARRLRRPHRDRPDLDRGAAAARPERSRPRPARAGDSVSPIIITSNDLAAAWAADADGDRCIR